MKAFLSLLILISLRVWAGPADLRLHVDAQTSLAARMTSLQQVSGHLDIESFYLEDDRIGRGLLKLILQAKSLRPQLQIRLLLDGWGSGTISESMACELSSAGIPTKFFNKDSGIFNQQRTHRKIWIADGLAFVGGRNLSEENYSAGEKNSPAVLSDWDIELRGQVVGDIQKSFEQSWSQKSSVRPDCKAIKVENSWISKIQSEKIPQNPPQSRAELLPSWKKADVQWFADPVGDNSQRPVRSEVASLIHQAQTSLEVENAYFLPVGVLVDELGEAVKRKLQIELYLNGPNVKVQMAKYSTCLPMNEIQWWMDKNAKVTFTPMSQKTHAKSLFVDNEVLAIGSFNFDSRSINTNAETLLVIREAPEIFSEYKTEHARRMNAGLTAKNINEVFQAYKLTEAEERECTDVSRLKPLLKSFF